MYFYRNEVENRYDSYVSLCAEINSNTGTEFYWPSIKVPETLMCILYRNNFSRNCFQSFHCNAQRLFDTFWQIRILYTQSPPTAYTQKGRCGTSWCNYYYNFFCLGLNASCTHSTCRCINSNQTKGFNIVKTFSYLLHHDGMEKRRTVIKK